MSSNKSISKQSVTVKAFLENAAKIPAPVDTDLQGKLVFAMDATASREPCWDMACQIQADMFSQTAVIGKLQIQLCYYHGYNEFHTTDWSQNAVQLQQLMTSVVCKAGRTQIKRVIDHTVAESKRHKINAMVFVGDCMEEFIDDLLESAGHLALRGIPAFIFHEGYDPIAEKTFRQIAEITNGAYYRFDQSSAKQLSALLNAVAIFAVGGISALQNYAQKDPKMCNEIVKQLTSKSS